MRVSFPRDESAVVVVGGGPTGLMLAGELALAGVEPTVLERRPHQELAGSRAGGLHSRTIEIFDQRGIAERFLALGKTHEVALFGDAVLDAGDLPSRHPYSLGLFQKHIERPPSRCPRSPSSAFATAASGSAASARWGKARRCGW